jgi:hypothetical protein
MANHVLLNNIEHKDLKINTERTAEMGDNVWFAQTFPMEFRNAQAHYPILFQKDSDTGQFMPVALFGFENGDNLFLKDGKWDANYIPLAIQRLPFYIGFQHIENNGVIEKQRVITLDVDSPKVNKEKGADLFLPYGGNSDYLENIADILETLHNGIQQNEAFIAALVNLDLLEAVTLDIELTNGSKHQLIGFYTINEDNLNALTPDNIVALQQAGFIEAIYMVIASQMHIHDLVARKNAKLSA